MTASKNKAKHAHPPLNGDEGVRMLKIVWRSPAQWWARSGPVISSTRLCFITIPISNLFFGGDRFVQHQKKQKINAATALPSVVIRSIQPPVCKQLIEEPPKPGFLFDYVGDEIVSTTKVYIYIYYTLKKHSTGDATAALSQTITLYTSTSSRITTIASTPCFRWTRFMHVLTCSCAS